MTFEEAITALKRGLRVARPGWGASHIYIDDGFGEPTFCHFTNSGTVPGWSPTPGEMLASNWEITPPR